MSPESNNTVEATEASGKLLPYIENFFEFPALNNFRLNFFYM